MPFKEETGWLIEFSQRVSEQPCWYGKTDEGLGQTTDPNAAIRFSRAEDAWAVIDDFGWTEAKATDHMWCDYSHDWHERLGLTCCRDCGIVRRADDKNGPCKGPTRLRPMEPQTPVQTP